MRLAVDLSTPALADPIEFARAARILLESLAYVNQLHLATYPDTPILYHSGVRYIREPRGVETLVTIPAVIEAGGGDCGHLAAWRVAELRAKGENAKFVLTWATTPDEREVFHVMVRRDPRRLSGRSRDDNDTIEDPSSLLGMKAL